MPAQAAMPGLPGQRFAATALNLAAKIAEKSPVALQLAMQAALATYETGLSEGLKGRSAAS